MLPVAHHVARIGEQGVVGVHDALGGAGGARGESEIAHGVGAFPDRRCGRLRQGRRQARRIIGALERRHVFQHGADIGLRAICTPALLGDEGARAEPGQQRADLCAGVGAMQRWIAGEALPCAGQKRDHGFEPISHPQRDDIAGHETSIDQIESQRIDMKLQLAPTQLPHPVAQRRRIGPLAHVLGHQGIERLAAPETRLGVGPRPRRIVQRQVGTHAQLPNLLGSGLRFSANDLDSSFASSVSR